MKPGHYLIYNRRLGLTLAYVNPIEVITCYVRSDGVAGDRLCRLPLAEFEKRYGKFTSVDVTDLAKSISK